MCVILWSVVCGVQRQLMQVELSHVVTGSVVDMEVQFYNK